MPFSLKNALWRAQSPFADTNADVPAAIRDRMAQDIGMSAADLERHRFRWPSQIYRHPRV